MLKKYNSIYFSSLLISSLLAETSADISSVSDIHQYRNFCLKAAHHSATFSIFRTIPICKQIIETVSVYEGEGCLDIIKRQSPHFLHNIELLKKSDQFGNPTTYSYAEVGSIAPTTLRYIKIASDLEKFFGSLEDFYIVEIGGGYGGQCKIISDLFKFKKYIIIDLPEPLELARKFLQANGIENVIFLTPDEPLPAGTINLVISNYAYSELRKLPRKNYIEKIFVSSKRGYLLCNDAGGDGTIYANKNKLLSELSDYLISWKEFPEIPLTGQGNYLITWG